MKPISPNPNLIEQVHETLIDAIADGSLLPGERLAQEDIAARLNVSRQPVSHALALLKREGLAVEQGKRGLSVAPLDNKRVQDLYQVRAVLDGLAAQLAAQHVAEQSYDEALLNRLEQTVQAGRKAAQCGRVQDRIKADVAFHSTLYELSGNSAILETAAAMWPHFRRAMGLVLQHMASQASVWDEHNAIVTAIKAGQAEQAERCARQHVERVSAEVFARLDHYVADSRILD